MPILFAQFIPDKYYHAYYSPSFSSSALSPGDPKRFLYRSHQRSFVDPIGCKLNRPCHHARILFFEIDFSARYGSNPPKYSFCVLIHTYIHTYHGQYSVLTHPSRLIPNNLPCFNHDLSTETNVSARECRFLSRITPYNLCTKKYSITCHAYLGNLERHFDISLLRTDYFTVLYILHRPGSTNFV